MVCFSLQKKKFFSYFPFLLLLLSQTTNKQQTTKIRHKTNKNCFHEQFSFFFKINFRILYLHCCALSIFLLLLLLLHSFHSSTTIPSPCHLYCSFLFSYGLKYCNNPPQEDAEDSPLYHLLV